MKSKFMSIITENKKAYFDYNILEKYEAGIELKGFEVKSIKNGRINFSGSYAIVRNNEIWLLNADIPAYQPKNTPTNYDNKRTRRLLLKKSEIKHLMGYLSEKGSPRSDAKRLLRGLTLLPLKAYTKNGKVKIEIGLAKSRKKYDKRELIKKRDIKREIQNSKS